MPFGQYFALFSRKRARLCRYVLFVIQVPSRGDVGTSSDLYILSDF